MKWSRARPSPVSSRETLERRVASIAASLQEIRNDPTLRELQGED